MADSLSPSHASLVLNLHILALLIRLLVVEVCILHFSLLRIEDLEVGHAAVGVVDQGIVVDDADVVRVALSVEANIVLGSGVYLPIEIGLAELLQVLQIDRLQRVVRFVYSSLRLLAFQTVVSQLVNSSAHLRPWTSLLRHVESRSKIRGKACLLVVDVLVK